MLTVGISLDEWKLPLFSKILRKKGYDYSRHQGLSNDSILLKVKVKEDDIDDFKIIVEDAEEKAAKLR